MNKTSDENTQKKRTIFILIFLTICIGVILFLAFIVFTQSETSPEKQQNPESFGFEAGAMTNQRPSPEEIAADAERINPIPLEDPIPILGAPVPDTYEFLRNPDRARWYTKDREHYFEIELSSETSPSNILTTTVSDIEVEDAYTGVWDTTDSYIIFTKQEGLHSHAEESNSIDSTHTHSGFDLGNIWVLSAATGEVRQILDIQGETTISFVSNGESIIFSTETAVERIGIAGEEREVLLEIEPFANRSEMPYTPTLQVVNGGFVDVNVKLPSYFLDREEENYTFTFDGDRVSTLP